MDLSIPFEYMIFIPWVSIGFIVNIIIWKYLGVNFFFMNCIEHQEGMELDTSFIQRNPIRAQEAIQIKKIKKEQLEKNESHPITITLIFITTMILYSIVGPFALCIFLGLEKSDFTGKKKY